MLTCWSCSLARKREGTSWSFRAVSCSLEQPSAMCARGAHILVCRAQDHVQRFETIAGRSAMVRVNVMLALSTFVSAPPPLCAPGLHATACTERTRGQRGACQDGSGRHRCRPLSYRPLFCTLYMTAC